ncbi:MAG: M24 family metallopeptidase, partial [Roseiflexaceae bacterium]
MVILHTAADIAAMRKAGQLVAKTFAHIMPLVVPGVSTHTLDEAAERYIRANGATPAYKGYLGFPATICVAPNSVICHGIPS